VACNGYFPRINLIKDKNGSNMLAYPCKILVGRRITSLSYWMHTGLSVRQTEIYAAEASVPQPSPSGVQMATECRKDTNRQVLIRLGHNWLKQKVKHCVLKSINSSIIFEIGKNCLSSERSLLLVYYLVTGGVIKLIIQLIQACHCFYFHTQFHSMLFTQIWSVSFTHILPNIQTKLSDMGVDFDIRD
jgi:hypothetical protein